LPIETSLVQCGTKPQRMRVKKRYGSVATAYSIM
jgi:hypothetical protein